MWMLGLDIGSNSIGWAALDLREIGDSTGYEPCGIKALGVRIFPDGREPAGVDRKTGLPKIGESLAVTRRLARGMRRNRDRRLKRIRQFASQLVACGIVDQRRCDSDGYFIGEIDCFIDPYMARAKAAECLVSKEELARALFHICKRRGFLSNRRTDGDDKEVSERKEAMAGLASILKNRKQTLGQYLVERRESGLHLRFRGCEYDAVETDVPIYPTRQMYIDEFDTIRRIQGNAYLTDEQWDELSQTLLFQRPLIPVDPGMCSFEHGRDGRSAHPRAWRHLPLSHTFRIVQEVNNLRYQTEDGDFDLTQNQREILYSALETQKSLAFSKARTLLGLSKNSKFNLESSRRKKLDGNATSCDMRNLFATHGVDWDLLDNVIQNDIVQTIHDATDETYFSEKNAQNVWGLPDALIAGLSKKYYPSSHGRLSRECMEKLLPLMQSGAMYWEAAREVYGDHTDYSAFATGEIVDSLPYYGAVLRNATTSVRNSPTTSDDEKKYGRIPNPTVHVALNQLRKLVNALIERFGNPEIIHLELARNVKKAGQNYQELLKALAENTKKNDTRKKMFEEAFKRPPSGLDLIKMRLWEELAVDDSDGGSASMARTDVYTGKPISFSQLFSAEVEIEHILPFSRTYDNSVANRTVTFREVNRRKGGGLLPYQFAQNDTDIDAEAMRLRAQRLPRNKRWRFGPDAADVYEKNITRTMTAEEKRKYDVDREGAYIDRQLVDTQYVSKIAARYLVPVVGEPSRVVPINGHITNLVRNKWQINAYKDKGGLNERQDHRHHAEDALIVALTSRALIKKMADKTRLEQERRHEFAAKIKFPDRPQWVSDSCIREAADRINVSFKQDHSREAKLYQETAYGLLSKHDRWNKLGFNGVVRRPILALKDKEVSQIRDDSVRAAVADFLDSPDVQTIKKWEDKMSVLARTPIQIGTASEKVLLRRVRIVVKNQSITAIGSAPYKGYSVSSIAFCDIWQTPKYNKKGKATGKWGYVGVYVSYADAKKYENDESALHETLKPHPAARKIMRLFKNDMVLLVDEKGQRQLSRVAGFSATNNCLDVRPHMASGGDRHFKSIPVLIDSLGMEKVSVTIDGRLH